MFKKLLVAYDNEKQSLNALNFAIDIAKDANAEIIIVTAIKVPDTYMLNLSFGNDANKLDTADKNNQTYHTEKLEKAADTVKAEGIAVQFALLTGNPGEAIVDYATNENIDLIVLGSNNHGIIKKAVLGSVSSYVVNHSACAVTIVKG